MAWKFQLLKTQAPCNQPKSWFTGNEENRWKVDSSLFPHSNSHVLNCQWTHDSPSRAICLRSQILSLAQSGTHPSALVGMFSDAEWMCFLTMNQIYLTGKSWHMPFPLKKKTQMLKSNSYMEILEERIWEYWRPVKERQKCLQQPRPSFMTDKSWIWFPLTQSLQ